MLGAAFCMLAGLGPSLAASLQRHDSSFTPHYALHVTYETVNVACRTKLLGLVNGTSPGPVLYLKEGETTWVRVYNDQEGRNLTMVSHTASHVPPRTHSELMVPKHWHGLAQAAAPFSDGTPQASQWAIAPGYFFDYEIKPAVGEAGTYFYHSHVNFQASSVSGPIIVEEASGTPPYAYDEDKILFVSEYFNKTDEAVVAGVNNVTLNWPGEPGSHMVNGGTYPPLGADETQSDEPWQASPANDECSPEVIQVAPNSTYRLRFIGGVVQTSVAIVFEDHDSLDVINVDGAYTKPAEVDRIQLGSGQRYDLLLRTKTEEELSLLGKSLFYIQIESRYRPVNVTSYAFLQYVGAANSTVASIGDRTIPGSPPATPPLNITTAIQDWLEYTLEPLEDNDFPSADQVTRTVYLYNAQLHAPGGQSFWSVNNHTWTEGNQHLNHTSYYHVANNSGVPYLVDVYQRGEAAIPDFELAVSQYGGWDPNLNVYPAKIGEIVDIVLINEPTGTIGGFDVHPWHLHGGHAYDLGSGPGMYDASANEAKMASMGYKPALRDTVQLYKYVDSNLVGDAAAVYTPQGWRAWRLRVQDAGVWMIHCHLQYHMLMGMQTVWIMGNASEITAIPQPYAEGYLSYGGSAYGNASYDPLVYHQFNN